MTFPPSKLGNFLTSIDKDSFLIVFLSALVYSNFLIWAILTGQK